MSVYGVCMVRDEIDILPYTLPRMLNQLDGIVIADNLSKDGTREWLAEYAADHNIVVSYDEDLGYYQSLKMTRLARLAADMGADWIVPFDADEVWVSPSGPLRDIQRSADSILAATLYDHVATSLDPDVPDPVVRLGWMRKEPCPLPKVAFRVLPGFVIEQGNHGVHYPGHVHVGPSDLIVHHYPYRSAEQMIRKARNGAEAYAATDLPYESGRHWRDYGALIASQGEAAMEDVFYTWFHSTDPESELVHIPCPA